jgi:serine/threonine protein kinase
MWINDRYHIKQALNEGKFGKVFLATDVVHEQPVAIKMDKSEANTLRHEATILNYLYLRCNKHLRSRLSIPRILWYGQIAHDTSGAPISALVIPYYECTLTEYLQHSPLDIGRMYTWMQSMLTILKTVHELYVIHCDLKPDNWMLDVRGNLILIDFGMATFYVNGHTRQHRPENPVRKTDIIGSPLYASLFTHAGRTPSRRDDVIQMAYIFLYMTMGNTLPWSGIPTLSSRLDDPYNVERARIKKEIFNSYHYIRTPDHTGTVNTTETPYKINERVAQFLKKCYLLGYDEAPCYDF